MMRRSMQPPEETFEKSAPLAHKPARESIGLFAPQKEGRPKSFATASLPAFLALFAVMPPSACWSADAWKPDQRVEIVVGVSAGAASDTTARWMHRLLTERKLLEVNITVVNRAGGGGTVALKYLNQQAGDGHYLMATSPNLLTNHITGRSSLNYTDVTPLAQLGRESVVFSVRSESPIGTARDLADRLKADPASLTFAVGNSTGSHGHIATAQVARAVGADPRQLKVVTFGGSAEGVAALLGGHIDVVASPPSAMLHHVRAGRARFLAMASDKRQSGELASVPTWKELGINAVASSWRSIIGPRGLSEEQVRYWDGVFGKLAALPEWRQDLESRLVEHTYFNSRDTRNLMEREYRALAATLSDLGLAKSPSR
jgi:putative tricarboxylic transport membrane protein